MLPWQHMYSQTLTQQCIKTLTLPLESAFLLLNQGLKEKEAYVYCASVISNTHTHKHTQLKSHNSPDLLCIAELDFRSLFDKFGVALHKIYTPLSVLLQVVKLILEGKDRGEND